MELSSSRMYTSPSFNKLDIAHIADRVVNELRTQNDDDFTFSDEEEEEEEEEEGEFEFPVSTDDDPIPLHYPVFDRTLLSPLTEESKPKPPRPSLKQLFNEDRDTPGTYCVWEPNTNTNTNTNTKKHKKSSSVSVDNNNNNIWKRWKVRDLLKRSYSDDNNSYSNTTGKESPVVVFLPPIEEKVVKSDKVEKNIPAYKTKKKIGNIRIPNHYHFRQAQLNGATTNLYRY